MPRTIDAAVITELSNPSKIHANLIWFDFDPGVYITDHSHDITWDNQTYASSGHIMGLSGVIETSEIKTSPSTLTLSAVDRGFVSLLNSHHLNIQVDISRTYLTGHGVIIGSPILLYRGFIDSFETSDIGQTSTILLRITSHWADFDKINGRRTNNESQQANYPGDQFFAFSSSVAAHSEIAWGRPG